MVELLELFNLKSPGNMSEFNTFFSTVTSIKIIDSQKQVKRMMYLPEQDPYSLNFQNAGYITTLIIYNAASMIFNFSVHFSLITILLILYLITRCCKRLTKARDWMKYYLFWNGSIRLFMEAYLELVLFALLNVSEVDWAYPGLKSIRASNYSSYVILGLCCTLPLLLLGLAYCYR